jgi:hypothetical protein
MSIHVSLDGMTFAKAIFPKNMILPDHGYTLLESNSENVYLDVFMEKTSGAESGNLFISNFNGTSYQSSIEATNRDFRG